LKYKDRTEISNVNRFISIECRDRPPGDRLFCSDDSNKIEEFWNHVREELKKTKFIGLSLKKTRNYLTRQKELGKN
jgi:hypothetical protein